MNCNVHGCLSIDVPASWSEHTNVIYGLTAANGAVHPLVSITLSPGAERETLVATLNSMLAAIGLQAEFRLLERRESTLGGRPAASARYTSRVESGTAEGRVTIVAVTQEGRRRTAMFLTTLPADADAETRSLCEKVLESVRFSPDAD